MARQILFRGYDIIGNKWVYGDLTHNQKVTRTGLEPRTMVGGYEVDPDSVGEWTGFVDYAGNKVYEGDTILVHVNEDTYVGYVDYDSYRGCFILKYKKNKCSFVGFAPYFIEVIGNTYQNK